MAALAATTAFAQSSVTLYGNLDQTIYRTNTNGSYVLTSNSNASSTSLLGIGGSEDVGGGTKVNFDFRAELNLGAGFVGSSTSGIAAPTSYNSEMFNRGAWIGIGNSGMGDLKVGRQNDAWWETTVKFNNTGVNSFGWGRATAAVSGSGAADLAALSGGAGISTAAPGTGATWIGTATGNPGFRGTGMAFVSGLSYETPAIANFKFKVTGGVPKTTYNNAAETNNIRAYSLNYANGPLTAAWATTNTNIGNDSGIKNTMIAAKYAMGPYTFTLAQNQTRLGAMVTAAQAHDADVMAYGVGYAINPKWNLDAGYTTIKDKINTANKYTMTGVTAKYALSKRSTWYVSYGRGASDGAAKYTAVWGGSGMDITAGVGETTIMTGLRHQF